MSQGRDIMKKWVIEALGKLNGQGRIVEICKEVWLSHEADIRAEGDLLYEWQYEIRWAGSALRDEGKIKPASNSPRGIWELS
jgi:hypothetical protein